jgi:hypothetical protein
MERIMNVCRPLIPALITFGPLFMVMSNEGDIHRNSYVLDHTEALYGALALGIGLAIIFVYQSWLEIRIKPLEDNIKETQKRLD